MSHVTDSRNLGPEDGRHLLVLNSTPVLPTSSDLPRSVRLRNAVLTRFYQARNNWRQALSAVVVVIVLLATVQVKGRSAYDYYELYSSSSLYSYGTSDYDPSEISSLAPEGNVRISKSLQHLADIDEPLRDGDVPFFFHVPRSGGSTVKDILGSCLGMVEASDVGARKGHKYDKTLAVIQSEDGSSYVNVDTSTTEGIHRAKRLGLVEAGLADVIITQHLHPAATMFNTHQRGRMFTMLRHPIERAVSLFHYLGVADWEPTYDPDLAYISIEMYARSNRIEHNWMVRFLSNELERDLTPKHLEVAKEVLRKKCIIGLIDQKSESFRRLQMFFKWTFPSPESKDCLERLLHWGWSNKHAHPNVEEGSAAWDLLYKKNELDMMLYEYAKDLFDEQIGLFTRNNGDSAERPKQMGSDKNQMANKVDAVVVGQKVEAAPLSSIPVVSWHGNDASVPSAAHNTL